MLDLPDIDIDLADRDQLLKQIKHVPAAIRGEGKEESKHNTGVYTVDIPVNPIDTWAAFDYKRAEQLGYFKLDILNVGVYTLVRDRAHLEQLLKREPDWSQLWLDPGFSEQIIHINGYSQLLKSMQPDSLPRIAAFISIIRPGKSHLQYKPWSEVFASVWDGDTSKGYTFKRAHAISYAMLVKVHINVLQEQLHA